MQKLLLKNGFGADKSCKKSILLVYLPWITEGKTASAQINNRIKISVC